MIALVLALDLLIVTAVAQLAGLPQAGAAFLILARWELGSLSERF